MKNFYRYLAPFAPDYSGAVAVLYETDALIVICDPGGCSGNVCGYDEPRFYKEGGAVYSAALRDMDTIWGQDDRLLEKIVSAAELSDFDLIALVGTPVVSIIATDLEAMCQMIEKKTGIPAVSVNTNGLDLYDKGQKKARRVLEKRFPGKYRLGPTPLDSMPDEEELCRIVSEVGDAEGDILIIHQKDAAEMLRERLEKKGRRISTGSWFSGCDIRFDDEDEFIDICMDFDVVIADPLYFRALRGFKGKLVSFPHLAVSGDLFI